MNTKKLLALLLAFIMIAGMLAGCGSSNSETVAPAEKPAAEAAEPAEEAEEAEEAEDEEVFTRFDDLETVNMVMMAWGAWDGVKEVEEEVNKITEAEINVHVNVTQIPIWQYGDQVGLMLAGGESIDLMMCGAGGATGFLTLASNNQLMDIKDILPVYAPGIMELMADPAHNYMPANNMDGKQLAVPALRMYTTAEWIFMRRDILEALDLTEQADAIDSWSDLEEALKVVRDAQPTLPAELQTNCVLGQQNSKGIYLSINGCDFSADAWADNKAEDYLGSMYMGCDPETDTVYFNYTTDAAIEHYNMMRKWAQEGLLYPDAPTSTDYSDNMCAAGMCFAYPCNGEYGCAAEKSKTTGYPLMAKKVAGFPITTAYPQGWSWAVPVTAENPEAAAAVLNLMYTNKDVENLFVWGIEGRDYAVNEIGEAYRLEDTCKYQAIEFFYGNQFNAHGSVGQGATIREEQWADNTSGRMSKYFGFCVDTTPIANEMTAVQNVIDQYQPQLQSGLVDAASIMDAYEKDLKDAGVDVIVQYYQDSLNAWLGK
ncbi:MAG: ABC transporter substrate-binding protein [Oscillospiraceae bacterium]|nr:ABC transporter substrate-binding protein [Oscillospiraceae bacterium]